MDVVGALTGFARALRAAGVNADRTRLTTALAALGEIDPGNADDVYWAARLALCSEPDDLPRFDALFDMWFRGARPSVPASAGSMQQRELSPLAALSRSTDAGEQNEQTDDDVLRTAASETEILRHRDLAALTGAERAEVHRLIALLAPRVGTRRTLRRSPRGNDRVDVRRTVRQLLKDGGEPGVLRWTGRREKPRRLVLLLDVSGSMAPYADALLRFGHAAVRAAPATTEVFTLGTRLTRVTRQLRLRDPDLALAAAGNAIPDWSGGTRLGDALRAFLDIWGQRGMARRAVVVIASDGWERGDARLLGEQMHRLARLAHLVVWVNPHRGKRGFAPVTGGMVAALPHLDELIAGHSLEALKHLAEVIGRA
ncbi:MAG TPA: VWA domain-containing protein [Jatrophihabitans sp.]